MKLTIDTKKPLGSPNGIRIGIIAGLVCAVWIDTRIAPQVAVTRNYTSLLYPFVILIIPVLYPLFKWIKLNIIHRKVYKALMDIVHAEQLVEYSPDKNKTGLMDQPLVLFGVKIIYEEKDDKVYITFYPRGIKRSDSVRDLGSRLEEALNMNLISKNQTLQYTQYVLSNVESQRTEVNDNDF